jgi:starvation-inducible outer membrane lipoprotein
MKKIQLIPLILTLLTCLSFALVACTTTPKADPAKIEACKESAKGSSDDCKKCCKAAGASGHMWTSGSGCKCL